MARCSWPRAACLRILDRACVPFESVQVKMYEEVTLGSYLALEQVAQDLLPLQHLLLGLLGGPPLGVGIRPQLIPEKFHDRFFAVPSDTKSYVEKVVALLNNPLTAKERQILHDHALGYTWDMLAKQYLRIISQT
jgi:hypothetical protein